MSRDVEVERELSLIAGQAAGVDEKTIRQIDDRADERAHDGPVRLHNRDLLVELEEEILDGRNYALWAARQAQPGLIAGDHEEARAYDKAMRTLAALQVAYRELKTDSQ